jgi:hypothetical protein
MNEQGDRERYIHTLPKITELLNPPPPFFSSRRSQPYLPLFFNHPTFNSSTPTLSSSSSPPPLFLHPYHRYCCLLCRPSPTLLTAGAFLEQEKKVRNGKDN